MSKQGQDKQRTSRRRSILKFGASIGMLPIVGAGCTSNADAGTAITPAQTKGPFYPVDFPLDKDADLTVLNGADKRAQGSVINVFGKVSSVNGDPLENVVVEIWQADTNGRYRHPRDPNPATLDPDFQGWGTAKTDKQGRYRFVTVFPGVYPAGPGWMRPPHIHFKVSMKNRRSLVTQMYFPENKYNESDLILQRLSDAEQQRVISKQVDSKTDQQSYLFDIFL